MGELLGQHRPPPRRAFPCVRNRFAGGGGASDPCTRDQFDPVGATLQFMDALGIDKAAIVGNSMGGGAALVIADDHPERIST